MSSELLYKPGNSWLHSLDPRTKIIYVVTSTTIAFLFFNVIIALLICLVNFALVAWSTGINVVKNPIIKLLAVIMILNVVIHGFANPAGKTSVTIFGYLLTLPFFESMKWEGMYFGMVFGLRVLGLGYGALLLVSTTHPRDLINSLKKIGLPLKYGLMLTLSIQLIPQMSEEAKMILNAQRARGVRIKSNIDKFKALLPVLVPLTIGSLERMNTIAMSISARGYGAPIKPTELKEIKMRIKDYLVIFIITISLVVAIYIRLTHGDLNVIENANSFINLFSLPL